MNPHTESCALNQKLISAIVMHLISSMLIYLENAVRIFSNTGLQARGKIMTHTS